MDIVLFGIQGSGKGTQGKRIAEKYDMSIFETGAELRKLSKEHSPLGLKVKAIINAGYLVPVEVVMEIIENFLKNVKSDELVLFDGIPRSDEQMEQFNSLMARSGRAFKGLLINIPKEMAMDRLLSRQICEGCKEVFPASYDGEVCEKCGGKLVKRADDNEDSILTRLSAFVNETMPVIKKYKTNNQMIDIDGTGSIDNVTELVFAELNKIFA
ncbi:MAG: nucleoside monophosphate kinase [Candidatus Peregrinibacteria bacterium]|nr:nucleoside monophosphate kinase [Candidatus Peregrinibacteria bacterium]MDZ4245411.1 nucleoside monophosphate kinase [Candidatus Gracilibacteria bacterium]